MNRLAPRFCGRCSNRTDSSLLELGDPRAQKLDLFLLLLERCDLLLDFPLLLLERRALLLDFPSFSSSAALLSSSAALFSSSAASSSFTRSVSTAAAPTDTLLLGISSSIEAARKTS